MVAAALDRRDGPMPFGAEHWRMDDGTIRQRGVLALVKFGKVALEGPAQSGQLSLETFVPEAELFINGQCLMGTKKYHEGGIQKQPSRQEELRSDECAEKFAKFAYKAFLICFRFCNYFWTLLSLNSCSIFHLSLNRLELLLIATLKNKLFASCLNFFIDF